MHVIFRMTLIKQSIIKSFLNLCLANKIEELRAVQAKNSKNQYQRELKFYISGCQNTPQMKHNRYTVRRLAAIWQQVVFFFFSQTKTQHTHSDGETHTRS